MRLDTDYGRPMKPFFIEIQNFWAQADKLGRLIVGHLYDTGFKNIFSIWGISSQTISTHFDTVSPLPLFSIIQPLFLCFLFLLDLFK